MVFLVGAIWGELNGQTVLSGIYNGTVITGDVVVNASTTATFTGGAGFTGANATMGNSAQLTWNQDGTLAGKTFSMGSGSSYAYINIANGRTLTFDGATSVTGVFDINGTTGSTIINQGTMSATSGTSYLYGPTLTNQGTITASGGADLYFGYNNGETTTNAAGGTITANGSGSIVRLHTLANQGALNAQNSGQLIFTGASTAANLGTVQLSTGGRALLNGTIDNTATTISAPAGGVFELYGGTINNGTIGAGALTFTNSNGTLSNVTYTGNLNIAGSTSVTFTNGTTFTGTGATLGAAGQLTWNQDGTLAGKTITMGSGSSYGYINVGNGRTLTFNSATSVTGVFDINGTTGSSIINQGTMSATSGTSYLYGPTLTNQGTITASGGADLYFGYNNGETTTNAAGGTITADGNGSIVRLHSLVNQGTLTAQNSGQLIFTGASTTTANLGTVQLSTGGRALLNGTIDNTAATFIAPTGGVYELYGGTINNGTIGAGALTFTNSNGTLSNVSYTGNLNIAGSTSVTFTNGTTFTGANSTLGASAQLFWNQDGTLAGKTFTMGSGSSYGYINVGNGRTLTFDNATSVTGIFDINGTTASTIINQGVMSATTATSYLYGPTLTNQGTITASGGADLYFGYNNGETTTNAAGGTIAADGSGSIVRLHSLVNQGTLTAQNSGQLIFTGSSTTTANLGTVQLSTGGRALLNGTIDNTAATFIAPTGGVYELFGGTINNGTIGAGALSFTNSGGTLSNVSYTGNLNIAGNTSVAFTNGTTFTGTASTLGASAQLYWSQDGTLTGKTFTMGSGSSYGYINVGNGRTLTFDNATSVTGVFDINGTTGSTIINQGTMSANAGTSYLYGPTLTNQGAISASGGADLYFGYNNGETTTNAAGGTITANGAGSIVRLHSLVNQGTLTAQNSGQLIFTGASTTTANLGTVQLSTGGRALLNGTIDNTAATFIAPTGGVYELYGGTINNGTIGAGALTFTNSGGTLSNVSYTGNLNIPANTYVTFTNGTSFSGASSTLGAGAQLFWNQNGTLAGKTFTTGSGSSYAYFNVGNSNSLTFDSATSVTGVFDINGTTGSTIINQGTMSATSGTSYLYAPTLTNQGAITAASGTSLYVGWVSSYASNNAATGTITTTGGTLYLGAPLTNNGLISVQSGTFNTGTYLTNSATGLIKGAGTINGNLVMAGGTLAPGNSVGTLTFTNSNFSVTSASTLNIEISGATSDQVLFQNPPSVVNIGSGLLSLSISLLSAPTTGVTYNIMNISSGGSGMTGRFAGLPNSGDTLTAIFGPTTYTFNVYYLPNGVALSVPEPSTYALLGAGLTLVAFRRLRLRRKAAGIT